MASTHVPAAPGRIDEKAWLGPGLALAVMGWGANQFAPLIVLYEHRLGLTAAALNGIFGLYALGLIPALLVGGRLSDRIGRRPVVLAALVVSAAGTCLLIVGGHSVAALVAGRTLSGVANGLAFGTGAAWVKELSSGAGDSGAGPRRATIAMTIGFSAGPFVSGILAQWVGAPTVVPYLPHLALLAMAVFAVRGATDPARSAVSTPIRQAGDDSRTVTRHHGVLAHFLLVLVPFSPWVFGTAAIALAYLPTLIAPDVAGHAMAFSAVVTGITALAGVLAQPLVRRVHRPDTARLFLISMGTVIISIAIAAWAAQIRSPWMVLVASALLGIAYGATQFCGLSEVQQLVEPRSLGTATAVYQILSYVGFSFPFLLSLTASHTALSPATLLLIVAGIAAAATLWLAIITQTYTHRGQR
ncbi:MFS transporter [Nocardia sp. NPDC020380]|uniref:MFS transporter n=1 Tax=Nocardia sp. NPDC020380 TaxID=3364309 RepID=UPI0037B4E775